MPSKRLYQSQARDTGQLAERQENELELADVQLQLDTRSADAKLSTTIGASPASHAAEHRGMARTATGSREETDEFHFDQPHCIRVRLWRSCIWDVSEQDSSGASLEL